MLVDIRLANSHLSIMPDRYARPCEVSLACLNRASTGKQPVRCARIISTRLPVSLTYLSHAGLDMTAVCQMRLNHIDTAILTI